MIQMFSQNPMLHKWAKRPFQQTWSNAPLMSRATNLTSAHWLRADIMVDASESPASRVSEPLTKPNCSNGIYNIMWNNMFV